MGKSKKGGSFIKQATILAGAGLFSRFIGFLYRPLLTGLIGDAGNAIYNSGYVIYNFLLILSSAGLPAAIGKMVSERIALKQYRNAHKVFRVAMVVSGTLGFVAMLIMALGANFIANDVMHLPESAFTIVTLAPTVFIVAIMSVFRGYFQGMNTMVPTAFSQVVEQIFNAFFTVFLAYLFVGQSIAMGAAGGTIGTGCGAIAGLIIVIFSYQLIRPQLRRRMAKEKKGVRQESSSTIARILVGTAFPIIIGTAIYSITNIADSSMVMSRLGASGAFTTEEATVLYGQLSGKFVVLTTLPVSISTAMATAAVPNIAASVVLGDRESVKRKLNMALKMAMVVSIPAAIGLSVLGDQIVRLLFASAPEGGILLQIGSISVIFLALSQIVTGILQGIGKVYIPVISAICGAIVKIVLNYVLIANPEINVVGAVISTIGCYVVASSMNLFMLAKVTKVKPDILGALVKPTFASIIMGISCYSGYGLFHLVISSNTICTLLSIFIGIIIYGVFMLLIRGLTKEEIRFLPGGSKLERLFSRIGLL